MFGEEQIKLMKPHAVVVNTSRGKVIDEKALAKAIAEGRLRGTAIDAFEEEPLPMDSPLRKLGNRALLSPHSASYTEGGELRQGVDWATRSVRHRAQGRHPRQRLQQGRAAALEAALRRGVDLQSISRRLRHICKGPLRRLPKWPLLLAPSGAHLTCLRTHAHVLTRTISGTRALARPRLGIRAALGTLRRRRRRDATGLQRRAVAHRRAALLGRAAAHRASGPRPVGVVVRRIRLPVRPFRGAPLCAPAAIVLPASCGNGQNELAPHDVLSVCSPVPSDHRQGTSSPPATDNLCKFLGPRLPNRGHSQFLTHTCPSDASQNSPDRTDFPESTPWLVKNACFGRSLANS